MRGRPNALMTTHQASRNTPAYAGKTYCRMYQAPQRWKHPRVCGEDSGMVYSDIKTGETPPRMRGRPPRRSEQWILLRNTPAYAGKTITCAKGSPVSEKHPRVCGEDQIRVLNRILPEETPPRMRGRLYQICTNICKIRNTPAYAGKTMNFGIIVA